MIQLSPAGAEARLPADASANNLLCGTWCDDGNA
jgi:hypothetical protein